MTTSVMVKPCLSQSLYRLTPKPRHIASLCELRLRHVATYHSAEAGSSSSIHAPSSSGTASAPLPFFQANFPSLYSSLSTTPREEEEQLLSALAVLHLSPTFSPSMYSAHTLWNDSGAFASPSQLDATSVSTAASNLKTKPQQQEEHKPVHTPEESEGEISDQEWEIRTGAFHLLQCHHIRV